MTKKELLEKIKPFDEDATLIFSDDSMDLLDIGSDGHGIANVIEINNGVRKYIVLVE